MRVKLEDVFVLKNGKESIFAELNFSDNKLSIFHPYLSLNVMGCENILTGDSESYNISITLGNINIRRAKKILGELSNLYDKEDLTEFYTIASSKHMTVGRGINRFIEALKKKDGIVGFCMANHSSATILRGEKKKNSLNNAELFFHMLNSTSAWVDVAKPIKEFVNNLKYPFKEKIEKFSIKYRTKTVRIKIRPKAIMNFYDSAARRRWSPAIVLIENPLTIGGTVFGSNIFSHWLVVCRGGFIEDDFSRSKIFGIDYWIISFPGVDLINIIVYAR